LKGKRQQKKVSPGITLIDQIILPNYDLAPSILFHLSRSESSNVALLANEQY
jgi:hypothetical protein